MANPTLPPDLFDQTTIISLFSTLLILFLAFALSRQVLPQSTSGRLRFLFIWHAFDALIHFCLEGSFLYHCFFSSVPLGQIKDASKLFPDPHNFLGYTDRVHGAQAGGDNPLAQLWMVYARADKRWAGVDLVFFPRGVPGASVVVVVQGVTSELWNDALIYMLWSRAS
jgi:hypothetical protein